MFDMLGNVLKNLGSKPATRMYPVEKREPFKDTRGKVGINIENCIHCGICDKKCPSKAISVNMKEKTWEIDPFKCIVCGVCEEVCPKKCIFMDEQYTASAYTKEKIRYEKPAAVEEKNKEAGA